METIKAIKRKIRIFWNRKHKKTDVFTGITLLLLIGIFLYSFVYTHTTTLEAEDTISTFSEGRGLAGFAVREETAERTTAVSEEVSTTETAEAEAIENALISTARTITRQSSTSTSSTDSDAVPRSSTSPTVSRTAPNAASRASSTQTDSSISRIVSPTKVERKTPTAAGERKVAASALITPAIVRTAITPLHSFESVKTETIQRRSTVIVQRTVPSFAKQPITISRKPVQELGEETTQKIEAEIKAIEAASESPAVKQVLELSPENKKITLVVAANPAQAAAPRLDVTVSKKPAAEYKPRLNQPWNPLGLFNAMLYGKKTIKTQSFSAGKEQALIAQQMDISSLKEGGYEILTQLTDRGKVLAADRAEFSVGEKN